MLTDHESDLLSENAAEFLKSFVVLGFDYNGEINLVSYAKTQEEQYALRQLIEKSNGYDVLSLILPISVSGMTAENEPGEEEDS